MIFYLRYLIRQHYKNNYAYLYSLLILQIYLLKVQWAAHANLDTFLNNHNTPGITNIDTRYLTRKLSKDGAKKVALINFGKNKKDLNSLQKNLQSWSGLENLDLATIVSTKNQFSWSEGLWSKTNKQECYKKFPIVFAPCPE